MRRLGTGLMMAVLLIVVGCSGETTTKEKTDQGQKCKTSSACALGQICEGGLCVDWTGCTPDSCQTGEICDENFECISLTDKCADSVGGCECHILNGSGNFEATATSPNIWLPAGASTTVTAVLATKQGTALPGAVFQSSIVGDSFSVTDTTLTAVADKSGAATLKVSFENTQATCEAALTNLGASPAGSKVRFFVVDDTTNQPIQGATLVVDTTNDGSDDGAAPATNADGLTTTANDAATFNVTVFAAGYNILSIAGLKAADSTDITLPLSSRTEIPSTGGFTGRLDFETYEKRYLNSRPSAIKVGVVTGSIPLKALLNFNLDLFIGEITDEDCELNPTAPGCYEIKIAGLYDGNQGLPGGLVFGLASSMIKAHFDSVTIPGRRFAWALGGELEIPDITGVINEVAPYLTDCDCNATPDVCDPDGANDCACDTDCGLNIDIGAIFADIVPLLSSFSSGLTGNLALPSTPMTDWRTHITGKYPDERTTSSSFPKLDDGSTSYGPLVLREGWSRFTALEMPALPADWGGADGAKMEGLLALSGIDATGYGFVPVGGGAALDCTEGDCLNADGENPGVYDGIINGTDVCKFDPNPEKNRCSDTIMETTLDGSIDDGTLGLFHAPAFGGLEGYTPKTITIAMPIRALVESLDDIRASALIHSGAMANGTSTVLKNRSFPGEPGQPTALVGRTYTPTDSGHDMHWVTMATETIETEPSAAPEVTTRWNIYFSDETPFTAPAIPATLSATVKDPFAASAGAHDIPAGKVSSTHMSFTITGAELSGLAANNGTTLNSFFDYVTGLSISSKHIPAN